jgi:hypothetical protein
VPHTRAKVTTNGTLVSEETSLPLDQNVLTAVACSTVDTTASGTPIFASITIQTVNANETLIIAALATGYVGLDNPIGWTGRIMMEPDMEVVVTTVTDTAYVVDLSLITEL